MNTPPTISLREHLLAGHGMDVARADHNHAPPMAEAGLGGPRLVALPPEARAEPSGFWLPGDAVALPSDR